MKSVGVVVGLAATVAGFVAQGSPILGGSEFESQLLVLWGALLLVLGQLAKARDSRQQKPAPAPVNAPAQAT